MKSSTVILVSTTVRVISKIFVEASLIIFDYWDCNMTALDHSIDDLRLNDTVMGTSINLERRPHEQQGCNGSFVSTNEELDVSGREKICEASHFSPDYSLTMQYAKVYEIFMTNVSKPTVTVGNSSKVLTLSTQSNSYIRLFLKSRYLDLVDLNWKL